MKRSWPCCRDADFNCGNILKAQKRIWERLKGGGKEGNSIEYDANKCRYYIDALERVHERTVHERQEEENT